MGRSVTVTGRGRASAPYDVATLNLAASARAANPSDATARASYAMQAMREAVVRGGADERTLATTSVSLNPVHDPWPTVVAYEASLSLAVRTTDLEHVGSMLVAERAEPHREHRDEPAEQRDDVRGHAQPRERRRDCVHHREPRADDARGARVVAAVQRRPPVEVLLARQDAAAHASQPSAGRRDALRPTGRAPR